MQPQSPPRIEVHYLLNADQTAYEPVFRAAAARYEETRTPEEAFSYESKEGDDYIFMKFGKNALRSDSFVAVSHQVDVMQEAIEGFVTHYHGDDVLPRARAGQALYGELPDPE